MFAADLVYFPFTRYAYYWTATADADNAIYAWCVGFYYGQVDAWVDKSTSHNVRAVRGEPSTAKVYINNGDGTITDPATGLMWIQYLSVLMDWEEAVSYCENLSFGGYDDWRLPNRNELQSIVDYTRYNSSINSTYFPYTFNGAYWTSTTVITPTGSGGHAWYVEFMNGNVLYDLQKTYHLRFRPVRTIPPPRTSLPFIQFLLLGE